MRLIYPHRMSSSWRVLEQVVPVMPAVFCVFYRINKTLEEHKTLFNSINGIIYPGGGVSIFTSGYANAARIFYELAIEANSRGDLTCLGFEELTYLTSGKMLLSHTNTSGSRENRMFKGFPSELLDALASEPITQNSH